MFNLVFPPHGVPGGAYSPDGSMGYMMDGKYDLAHTGYDLVPQPFTSLFFNIEEVLITYTFLVSVTRQYNDLQNCITHFRPAYDAPTSDWLPQRGVPVPAPVLWSSYLKST